MSQRIGASRLCELMGPTIEDMPVYRSLAENIRLLIADGRILHGTKLPSERDMVTALGMSRATISRAYAELCARGYAAARHGSGTVALAPGGPVPATSEPLPVSTSELGGDPSAMTHTWREAPGDTVDLTCAAPIAAPGLTVAYQRALDRLSGHLAGTGYHPQGLPELREAVAEKYERRGVPTSPSQIRITTGALPGIALALRALASYGDKVVVESPTYPNSVVSMRRAGLRPHGVPMPSDGSDMEALCQAVETSKAPVGLFVPDFHNPTGSLMSDADRFRLASALDRSGMVGIVDESLIDIDLDGDGARATPMAGCYGRIVSIGSATKSFWCGLRIGWIRAPRELTGLIGQVHMAHDLGAAVLEQILVSELLRDQPRTQVGRCKTLRESRDTAIDAVASLLDDWEVTKPSGGLSLWCRLPHPVSSGLVVRAERCGVALAPGSTFAVDGRGLENYVRIPYSLPPQRLIDGIERVRTAWRAMRFRH